jgi:hypothetical protein
MACPTDDWLKWAPAASAAFSAVAAFAAASNVFLQNRNAARNRSLDLLLKKEVEFASESAGSNCEGKPPKR